MKSSPIEILYVWEGHFGRLEEPQRENFLKNKIVKSLTEYDINLIQDAVLLDKLVLKEILKYVKENEHQYKKAAVSARIIEPGAYLVAGTIYSIRRDRRAQEWQIWTFDDSQKKYKRMVNKFKENSLLSKISPKSRLTLQKANEISLETGICCHCGRPLSAFKSVARGMGPICKKYYH